MPGLGGYLLFFLLFVFQVNCKDDKTKGAVQFLLSDAKQPNFDLEPFQAKGVAEDDSITSESIILPTLDMTSHPFAVVVLPNLNKFSPSKLWEFEAVSSKKEEIRNGGNGKDHGPKNENFPSFDTETNTSLGYKSSEIPVFSIHKNKGEIIKLQVSKKGVSAQNESISDKSSAINKTESKELPQNTEIESDIKTDGKERTLSARNKSFTEMNAASVKEASLERKSRLVLEDYPWKEGAFLFSPFQIPVPEVSREAISGEASLPSSQNLGQKIKNEISNKKNNHSSQIQTLPIVHQFSQVENLVPLLSKSGNSNWDWVSQTEFLTTEKSPEQLFNSLSDESPETKPFATKSNEKVSVLSGEEFLNNFSSSGRIEQVQRGSSQKTFDRLKLNRNTDEIQSQNNLDKSISKSPNHINLPLSVGQPVIQLLSRELPFKKELKEELSGNLDLQSNNKIDPSLQIPNLADPNSSNESFSMNVFEFVTSVGLSLPGLDQKEKNDSISELLPFDFKISSSENPTSPEQSDQIKQVIKIRNQLSLLDTATFLQKNSQKRKTPEINPERNIGSFKETNLERDNSNESKKTDKSITDLSKDKSKLSSNLLSASWESNNDFNLKTMSQTFNESSVNSREQAFKFDSEKDFLGRESVESAIMNWSNFLKIKNKTAKINEEILTGQEQTDGSRFSSLESIITPITPSFTVNLPQEKKSNKTFDVILEPFDVSNAMMPPKDESRPQITLGIIEPKILNLELAPNTDEQTSFSFHNNYEDSDAASAISSLRTSPNFKLSPRVKTQRDVPILIPDVQSSIRVPLNEIQFFTPQNLDFKNVRLSDEKAHKTSSQTESCEGKRKECNDITISSHDATEVTLSVTSPVSDFALTTVTQVFPVNETVLLKEMKLDTSLSTIFSNEKVEAQTERMTPFTDLTLRSPVLEALAEPITVVTSYTIHNILTLDTVTHEVTVTVTTPSLVFYTETETVQQTEFITVTETLPYELGYISTILEVLPIPSTVTINPSPLTVTETVNAFTTVTQTLYTTVCDDIDKDYPDEQYFSQLNNYGIDARNLVRNPFYIQSRPRIRRQRLENSVPIFDELYWPKKDKTKRETWTNAFNEGQFDPSAEPKTSFENNPSLADSEVQETTMVMSVVLPDDEESSRRARKRSLFNDFPLSYGIPFYGYKSPNREQLKEEP